MIAAGRRSPRAVVPAMAARRQSESRLNIAAPTSTKTGVAPACSTTSAVAVKVKPGRKPRRRQDRCFWPSTRPKGRRFRWRRQCNGSSPPEPRGRLQVRSLPDQGRRCHDLAPGQCAGRDPYECGAAVRPNRRRGCSWSSNNCPVLRCSLGKGQWHH